MLWGNVLLAGLVSSDSLVGLNPLDVEKWVILNETVLPGQLSFTVQGPCGEFEMVPLYTM